MTSKRINVISQLRKALAGSKYWTKILSDENTNSFTLHLAILREPYLRFIMEGKKTIETRFAKRACPPYQRVTSGDVVILKRSAGDIMGVCLVTNVWFYSLDPKSLSFIKEKFGDAICPADSTFWEERKLASVATLMLIDKVTSIQNVKVTKRDRRGWVVFKPSDEPPLL